MGSRNAGVETNYRKAIFGRFSDHVDPGDVGALIEVSGLPDYDPDINN